MSTIIRWAYNTTYHCVCFTGRTVCFAGRTTHWVLLRLGRTSPDGIPCAINGIHALAEITIASAWNHPALQGLVLVSGAVQSGSKLVRNLASPWVRYEESCKSVQLAWAALFGAVPEKRVAVHYRLFRQIPPAEAGPEGGPLQFVRGFTREEKREDRNASRLPIFLSGCIAGCGFGKDLVKAFDQLMTLGAVKASAIALGRIAEVGSLLAHPLIGGVELGVKSWQVILALSVLIEDPGSPQARAALLVTSCVLGKATIKYLLNQWTGISLAKGLGNLLIVAVEIVIREYKPSTLPIEQIDLMIL